MEIEIPDNVVEAIGEQELKEILAISLYRMKRINGVTGGEIVGSSEIAFHGLLSKYGETVGYSSKDLSDDIENLKDF